MWVLVDVKLDRLLDLSIDSLRGDGAILVSKVSGLCDVAEEADFDDARHELDLRQEGRGVFHEGRWEGAVDDEAAVRENVGSTNGSEGQ